jgi:hypothetical protein
MKSSACKVLEELIAQSSYIVPTCQLASNFNIIVNISHYTSSMKYLFVTKLKLSLGVGI